ncbi:MAG: hypothetical protein Q7S32_00085 [bacterium]|nr:hypothetical protein [bacterium]
MSELTKEYFDKKITSLKKDIDISIEKEVGGLARMTSNRFDELEKQLDVRKEVEQLKHQVQKIMQALSL